MEEFEFARNLPTVLNAVASRSLRHLEVDDPHSSEHAMEALRNTRVPLDAPARLRQEFTLGQRMALADMFRVVYAPDAPIAGTGQRMIDILVGD